MNIGGRGDDPVDQAGVLPDAAMELHAAVPLVALLGLVHLWIVLHLLVRVPPAQSGFALLKVELAAAIKVASTIAPWRIVMPQALRWALTISKICLP